MNRRLLLIGLGYLLLALVVTWPLALSLNSAYVGFANVDALDTMTLRGLVSHANPRDFPWTDDVFFPQGYPVLQLTPNLLDHLTGAIFDGVFPFPLSDNLWWLTVLTLNGLAGHRLGRRHGGSEAAGGLCGVALLFSEPLARELNLHHAPQSMLFWAPLYLDAILDLRNTPTRNTAILAGVWLAGAGWSYWYYAFFLSVASLPLLPGVPLKHLIFLGGTAGLIAAPGLLPWLVMFDDLGITAMGAPDAANPPESYVLLPDDKAFITQHGNDPLFFLRRTPLDASNRVSLSLLVAAVLGAREWDRRTAIGLAGMSLIAATMLLGPFLRQGADLVLINGQPLSLPFLWLGEVHPFFGRLTWPERWGMVVTTGLIGLAAKAPRPAIFAGVIALESFIVSGNLPVQTTTLRFERCWADLSGATGAIIELPLRRAGLRAPRVGVHRRFHRRPVINPILLPPGLDIPQPWRDWKAEQPLIEYFRQFESGTWPKAPSADAIHQMQQAGVSAFVLDVEPKTLLLKEQRNRYQAAFFRHFGKPADLGCAWVWWFDPNAPAPASIEDGDAWRQSAIEWKDRHPEPQLETLIQPAWDVIIGGMD